MAYHQQPPYGAYNQPPQVPNYQNHYQQQPPYRPQQLSGYPPQQQCPQQSYPPQQYAPPQGQYGQPPPGQNNYHAGPPIQPGPGYHPPPQQGGYPPNPSPQPGYNGQPQFQGQHQNYGPPGQAQAPFQGQHQNYGPPGQAQAPFQGQHQNYGPPGQGPGFAHQGGPGPGHQMSGGNYNPPPAPPTLGYVPGQIAPGDFTRQAETLRKAMKGFGTDEKAIIQTLAPLDPLQVAAVRATYSRHIGRDLYNDVKSETGGYLERGLLSVIEGPLGSDVVWARESVSGIGTKEWLMNETLLGRSNADIHAIKIAYQQKYHRDLERDVVDDLSFKTADLFKWVLQAARQNERPRGALDDDIKENVDYILGKKSIDKICEIMATASDAEIRAMDQRCRMVGNHEPLEKVMTERFSYHMADAFVFMIRTATDPALRDASLLHKAMDGVGTKDEQLVVAIVRLHWNRDHKDQVKRAYRHHYEKDLIDAVRGETSGDYEKLMVALLQ
ncbi:hypothetical protein N7493_005501 [Penicillium malachiteum]|uniref:Annexin n=1 Tax=Penicillium malachiteum TaxID=1324776 RepID=A0AAD6HNL4_9EURO|nr:hypothetical protein N7493_005501 [Penicillium malachiteum]